MKLRKALAGLSAVHGNDKLVYESSLYHLDSQTSREIYTFYSDIHVLNTMLKEHIRETKKESKLIKEGEVKVKGFQPREYGAVLHIPKKFGAFATMRMVQLGHPICAGEKKENPAGCGDKPFTGFSYIDGPNTKRASLPKAGDDNAAKESIVFLDARSPSLKNFVIGGASSLATLSYMKRIEAISAKVKQLNETGRTIKQVLTEKSSASQKFSFFM